MSAPYSDPVALILPTFFGSTNIPVLEARAFACAVLTSDIRGSREQRSEESLLPTAAAFLSRDVGFQLSHSKPAGCPGVSPDGAN